MLNQAQYELMNYPRMGAGYYLAKPFRDIFGVQYSHKDRMAYPNALLAKALMDFYKKNVNTEEGREVFELVKRYYDRWIFGGARIRGLEDIHAGMALMDMHRITGSEKYKNAADKLLAYLMSSETDETGSLISKNGKQDGYVYADTLGFVCPFLAKYGKEYMDMNAASMAISLLQNYMEFGMDNKLILPYHGYDRNTGMKYGIVGWGLATGRLMMGFSEVLYYTDPAKLGYEEVRQAYRRIVDKVEAYQLDNGLYAWQLTSRDGPVDTATTAMILYSIAQSLTDRVLIGIHKSRMLRGAEALKKCVQEDGTLPGASAECRGFNEYPIDFGSYPWALGPALSLFIMAEDIEPGRKE